MKKALITGISGQDGSYLAELLLSKNYKVYGFVPFKDQANEGVVDYLSGKDDVFIYDGDLTVSKTFEKLISEIGFDEIYHLGAQSHVRKSFDSPEYTADINALGTIRLLETIRKHSRYTKFYQASSSEMFGDAPSPQSEDSLFLPRSPYACSKLHAYWTTINYRRAYKIFSCNGILFNHESPRRGVDFVTRKITRSIASICSKEQDVLYLGNLEAKRDWGFAPEYVEAMWLMLQKDTPGDYVIGTGRSYPVREFVETSFKYLGIDIEWQGGGLNEIGIISGNRAKVNGVCEALCVGKEVIKIDPCFFRPIDVENLCADNVKAGDELGWSARVDFHSIVKIMLDYDFINAGLTPVGDGLKFLSENGFSWVNEEELMGIGG